MYLYNQSYYIAVKAIIFGIEFIRVWMDRDTINLCRCYSGRSCRRVDRTARW